jgi:hypothetical protein
MTDARAGNGLVLATGTLFRKNERREVLTRAGQGPMLKNSGAFPAESRARKTEIGWHGFSTRTRLQQADAKLKLPDLARPHLLHRSTKAALGPGGE